MTILVEGARLLVPMDDARRRLADGWVLVEDDRIDRGRARAPPPAGRDGDRRIDARGKVVLPGLRQHAPPPAPDAHPQRAARAGGAALPLAHRAVRGLARRRRGRGGRGRARRAWASCCSPAAPPRTDHLYLFPRGQERLIDVEIAAARELGIRFQPTRGSMSRGRSQGGLPPGRRRPGRGRRSWPTRRRLIREYHDPRPRAMTRIALAPCSPFSVTDDLMRRTRRPGARARRAPAHAPGRDARRGARTACEIYGVPAGRVPAPAGLARARRLARPLRPPVARTRSRCSARPAPAWRTARRSNFRLGSGIAPVRALLDAGAPVGLGVDGSASNDTLEHAGRGAPGAARPPRWAPTPRAGSPREEVLWMATRGGARCLGRDDIGSLEPGKAADLILVDTRRLSYAGAGSDLAGRARLLALAGAGGHRHGRTAGSWSRAASCAGVDVPALVGARGRASREACCERASRATRPRLLRHGLEAIIRPCSPAASAATTGPTALEEALRLRRPGRGAAGRRHAAAGLGRARSPTCSTCAALGLGAAPDRRRRPACSAPWSRCRT